MKIIKFEEIYRYDTRFAVPVYDENRDLDRYNVISAKLLIRHAASGKMSFLNFMNQRRLLIVRIVKKSIMKLVCM